MKLAKIRKRFVVLVLGAAAAAVGACQDSAVGPDEQIPTGLVVLDSGGSEVASSSGGGAVQVGVGESRTFRVVLTASGGTRIAVDGSRYTLRPLVVNGGVASATLSGADRVVVTGRQAGPTRLVLTVLDGGSVVVDPDVALTVS